jgi:hypothetical protein
VSFEIVTGEDGQQYYQFEGQVFVPSSPDAQFVIQQGANTAAYTLDQLRALQWPRNPLLPTDLTMTAKTWLPGDPGPGDKRSEPEHPTGRFENLDWEAGS